MRVVCITQDWNDTNETKDFPRPKKGDVCTVIDAKKSLKRAGRLMYVLLEYGNRFGYKSENFIAINEDQQDETEMQRNYNTQHA